MFLGYSLTQSAFLCYDLTRHKIFVSRNVRFVEHTFPYLSISLLVDTTFDSDPPANPWDSPAPLLRHSSTAGILGAPPPLPSTGSSQSAPISVSQQEHNSTTAAQPVSSSSPPRHSSNDHTMQTRSNPKYGLTTLVSSDIEPTTVKQALSNLEWTRAMQLEFDALIRNHTWELVPRDKKHNVVGCKWAYRLKRNSDGSIQHQKARLVALGFHQRPGVDFHETLSPVVNPVTVRTVLSIAVTRSWTI